MKKVLFSLMMLLICSSTFANDTIGYCYSLNKKCPIERWDDEWNSKTATYIQTNVYEDTKIDGYYYTKTYLVIEDSVMPEFIQYLKDLDRDWMAVYDSLYTHPDEYFPEYIRIKGKLNTTARFSKAKCWWFEVTPKKAETHVSDYFTINQPSIAIKWNRSYTTSLFNMQYGSITITQESKDSKDNINTVVIAINLIHNHLLDLITTLESIKF